jgi:hypothetical protein
MAARWAGGAAGPAPSHKPSESESGKAIYIYCDYCIICKHAGSVVIKAAGCCAHDRGFVPSSLQCFFSFCISCSWQSHDIEGVTYDVVVTDLLYRR